MITHNSAVMELIQEHEGWMFQNYMYLRIKAVKCIVPELLNEDKIWSILSQQMKTKWNIHERILIELKVYDQQHLNYYNK